MRVEYIAKSLQEPVRVRVKCFVVTRGSKGVLCVQQHCGRRYRSGIWATAGREGVQHADGDAEWRLGRMGEGWGKS